MQIVSTTPSRSSAAQRTSSFCTRHELVLVWAQMHSAGGQLEPNSSAAPAAATRGCCSFIPFPFPEPPRARSASASSGSCLYEPATPGRAHEFAAGQFAGTGAEGSVRYPTTAAATHPDGAMAPCPAPIRVNNVAPVRWASCCAHSNGACVSSGEPIARGVGTPREARFRTVGTFRCAGNPSQRRREPVNAIMLEKCGDRSASTLADVSDAPASTPSTQRTVNSRFANRCISCRSTLAARLVCSFCSTARVWRGQHGAFCHGCGHPHSA